jgi:hypothetical protein
MPESHGRQTSNSWIASPRDQRRTARPPLIDRPALAPHRACPADIEVTKLARAWHGKRLPQRLARCVCVCPVHGYVSAWANASRTAGFPRGSAGHVVRVLIGRDQLHASPFLPRQGGECDVARYVMCPLHDAELRRITCSGRVSSAPTGITAAWAKRIDRGGRDHLRALNVRSTRRSGTSHISATAT